MQKMNITWSAKQVTKMFNNGVLKFDNIIQRSYVWETKRKSDLIHSLIEGYPVPPFYARKVDGKYDFLDGKQRMSAIAGFINNEYYLEGIPEITYINESGESVTEDLNDVRFEDLPESVQDCIKDYSLTIYYYDDITDEQIRELFRKLNNGKPLSAKEKNIASMIDISNITELGKHELFERIMSEKALDARKHLPIIMKIWSIINNDISDVSFDSKTFNELVSTTMTTEEERAEIVELMDYYLNAVNMFPERVDTNRAALKKLTNETNVVSLMPFVKRAVSEEVSNELFTDWLGVMFTKEKTVSLEYSEACTAGAAKNTNIVKRNTELEKAWEKFFYVDEEATEREETEEELNEEPVESEDINESQSDEKSDCGNNDEYLYGMRVRGFSIGCQPMNGLIERRDSTDSKYWDVIVYNRELTEEEVNHYSLDRLAC